MKCWSPTSLWVHSWNIKRETVMWLTKRKLAASRCSYHRSESALPMVGGFISVFGGHSLHYPTKADKGYSMLHCLVRRRCAEGQAGASGWQDPSFSSISGNLKKYHLTTIFFATITAVWKFDTDTCLVVNFVKVAKLPCNLVTLLFYQD